MKAKIFASIFSFLLIISLSISLVQAATISYLQAGADPGTVMKGKVFTVTVSGLSGTGTVTLVLPSGFSTTEDTTKSFASGTSSVSWTTVVANQKLSGQTISAAISTTGTPETVTTTPFDVVLPPSLSASVFPTSVSVQQGLTFSLSLNIQNNGETTARWGGILISDSGLSIASGCSPLDIPAGKSSGVSCTIAASSTASTGTRTLSILIAPSNADSLIKTISVTITAAPAPREEIPPGIVLARNITMKLARGMVNITIPEIVARGAAKVEINRTEDMAVREITITVINRATDVRIDILKLPRRPADVEIEVTGKVYHYIKIDKVNLADENINKTRIRFEVSKVWIAANNIDENTISLYRYSAGAWQKLPTQRVGEDAEFVFYTSEFSSLSYFAISGEEKVVVKECPRCPDPSAWSECVEGKQTRTNYRCSVETNYECQAYTEERSCEVVAPPIAPGIPIELIIVLVVIVAVVLVFLILKRIRKL